MVSKFSCLTRAFFKKWEIPIPKGMWMAYRPWESYAWVNPTEERRISFNLKRDLAFERLEHYYCPSCGKDCIEKKTGWYQCPDGGTLIYQPYYDGILYTESKTD